MTDITTHNDTQQRLRRILDEETITPRATDHEIAPHVPPPDKSGGDIIADKSLSILDEATTLVLTQLGELKDKIADLEQVVLTSQVTVRDVVRAHMAISQQAMNSCQQIAKQVVEAAQSLAERTNCK